MNHKVHERSTLIWFYKNCWQKFFSIPRRRMEKFPFLLYSCLVIITGLRGHQKGPFRPSE